MAHPPPFTRSPNCATFGFYFGGLGMILRTSRRREFLSASIAASAIALGGLGRGSATFERGIFPRTFAGSRTVTSFATGLLFAEENMPLALTRWIDAELARTDVQLHSHAQERRQAEFFGWLAIHVVAPRALRRAGYEDLAVGCEKARDLRPGGAASGAQHTIGREFRSSLFSPRVQVAYGASAHASTCAFYATHDEIATVFEAGHYCARAIVETFCCEDPEAAETAWSAGFAVAAINKAIEIGMTDEGPGVLG